MTRTMRPEEREGSGLRGPFIVILNAPVPLYGAGAPSTTE